MSDLMPQNISGVSAYYCGYPLKSAKKYVISKTWAAPEMPRPGCVWTHSILLDYSTVAKLNRLSDLFYAFKRPNGSSNSDSYAESFEIDLPLRGVEKNCNIRDLDGFSGSDLDMQNIIAKVYASKYERVAIASFGNQNEDDVTVSLIWNQMPPRLRRDFVFSSAASLRSITPQAAITLLVSNELIRSAVASDVIDEIESEGISILVDDIFEYQQTQLRNFIARYISDAKYPRKSVLYLALIGGKLLKYENDQGISEAANLISNFYKEIGDSDLIKREFVTGAFFSKNRVSNSNKCEIVATMILPYMRGMSWVDFNDSTLAFVKSIENEMLPLIAKIIKACFPSEVGTLGYALLSQICKHIDINVLAKVQAFAEVKLTMAALKIELLGLPDFWRSFESPPDNKDWELLKSIGNSNEMVRGMLDAGMYEAIKKLVDRDRTFYTPALVVEIIELSGERLELSLKEFRSLRLDIVDGYVNSGRNNAEFLNTLALDIFNDSTPRVVAEAWINLITLNSSDYDAYSNIALFVIFDSASNALTVENAVKLFEFSFQRLHSKAMLKTNLENQVGQRISGKYMGGGYSRGDDAAPRIRRHLCEFMLEKGGFEEFFFCAGTEENKLLLLQSMSEIWGGSQWLERLRQYWNDGRIYLAPEICSLIERLVPRKSTWSFFDLF
ncbi:hypothetical protein MRBLMU1_000921 [Burkholderia sp. LMU1-1-1.1]